MMNRLLARSALLGLAIPALVLGLGACQPGANAGQSAVVDGLRLEYGVVPSEVVQAHDPAHPEAQMHEGALENGYHVTLAVFDAQSSARIDDANVTLKLSGPGHPGNVAMPLELMTIANSPTYGRYVALPRPGRYQLTFDVARPGRRHDPATARFTYELPD